MDDNTFRVILPLLPVFSSGAKHLSFTKAAEELCLSQGAVSQNIKKLENILGFPLFHRFVRHIALTEEGRLFYAFLTKSLSDIKNEIRNIRKKELAGPLNISCPPSFATNWLAPRLADFVSGYPSVTLHVSARLEPVKFEEEEFDMAICYGTGNHPGLSVTYLMSEMITPVCSREYADKFNLWNNPEALHQCHLLHDSHPWFNARDNAEWKSWVDGTGFSGLNYRRGCSFDYVDQALTAAVNHAGIAMGRKSLVSTYLESGRLVAPLDLEITVDQAYYLISLQGGLNGARIAAFRNWLLKNCNS